MARPFSRLLGLLGLLLLLATPSLQDTKDPVNDFCRRWGHQAAVIDRRLYIDGGQVDWNPLSQNPLNYTNTWLLYNDLNTQVPGSDLGMPQLYANLSKNSTIPSVSGGILWADEVNKIFYLYGGEFTDSSPTDFTLFGYDVILNQWNASSNTPATILRPAWGAGVGVNDRAEGFYLGGWLSNTSVPGWSGPPIATSNLIKYDMIEGTWTNNTGPPDNLGRAEGVLVYLPASDGGLLVYFGGIISYPNGTINGSDMSSINIFDIASQKWYVQTATGDIPESRRKFCAGATWAPDKSSYNVYLYGGQGITNITGFDDVYILTMPSFQWIKWYPREPGAGNPHGLSSCSVISNSQMLIIGGWFNQNQDCDSPNVWGTHNLNLGENGPNDAPWDLYWPNITNYSVPPEIIDKIGGGPNGGATMLQPQNNWDNRDLPVYFSRVPSFAARTATRYIPPTASISNSPNGTSSHHSDTGAIVGGAVGGAIGLLLLVGLAWCCLRRHKNKKDQNQEFEPPQNSKEKMIASPYVPLQAPVHAELPTIPPQELESPDQDLYKTSSTRMYVQPRHSGSPMPSQPSSPGEMTLNHSYPSPTTPYGTLPQGQYFGHSPPTSAYPTGTYPPNISPSAAFSPQFAQQPQLDQRYDASQEAYHHQHFPPPPDCQSQFSRRAPSPPSSTAYSDEAYPPTTSPTPAHFYPQPLNVPRHLSGSTSPRNLPPSRGRFVEHEL